MASEGRAYVASNAFAYIWRTVLVLGFEIACGSWGGRRGLNPRHSVPQTDALPAELLPPLELSLPCRGGAAEDRASPPSACGASGRLR